MDDLTGRIALVTGASRGIGRASALALAAAGCDVAVNYRERAQDAEAVADAVRSGGRRALAIQADVSRAAEVRRLVDAAVAGLGPIDVLVNNAGVARPLPLEEIGAADWDEHIAVNLTSCFLVSQAVIPSMRRRGWGRLIHISSVAAQVGGVVGPHYAASKAGMLGLSHGYAALLARDGVTSNAIAPALIETDMVRGNPNVSRDRIPVGRFGDVEETASVVVLLARNPYITGQTLNVNGGWYLS
jgi:3-oxoacyl-[acyl-carrier protein] reductase